VLVQLRTDSVEHIGHEVEHVLEFIEKVNLREKLAHPRSGVTMSGVGYETDRAVDAGRRVAREVRDNRGTSPQERSPWHHHRSEIECHDERKQVGERSGRGRRDTTEKGATQ